MVCTTFGVLFISFREPEDKSSLQRYFAGWFRRGLREAQSGRPGQPPRIRTTSFYPDLGLRPRLCVARTFGAFEEPFDRMPGSRRVTHAPYNALRLLLIRPLRVEPKITPK